MSWEIIACCVWVIAIIWCIVEAWNTPSMTEDFVDEDIIVDERDEDVFGQIHTNDEDDIIPPNIKELYISNNKVREKYREFGCQAVIDLYLNYYLNEEGDLVTQKGLATQIFKIMDISPEFGFDLEDINKWNKISEIISNSSIKKGFK